MKVTFVLILIVVDNGLVQRVSNVIEAVYAVLILIVVDNGLVLLSECVRVGKLQS